MSPVVEKLNASSLRQARRARKLSASAVATFTKISESRLHLFEAGDAEPSIKQLARLSDLYNAPMHSFYRPEMVEIEATLPDFRKATPVAANLSPRGLNRLWQVEKRSKFVEELVAALGGEAPKTSSLLRHTNSPIPEPTELRTAFDEWRSKHINRLKFQGSNEDKFLKYLRLFLENHNCLTAINSAPIDDYLGFYNDISRKTRVIFVNRDIKNEKRKLFTLSHELAHFIYDKEGISNPFSALNAVERQCNVFAATFLAPDDMVWSIVNRLNQATVRDTTRLVSAVAKDTLLSRQASALRLNELGIITRTATKTFFAYLSMLKRDAEPSGLSPTNPPIGRNVVIGKVLSEVGVYASYVASEAVRKKFIDLIDVERGLGISESIQADVLSLATRRYEASAE